MGLSAAVVPSKGIGDGLIMLCAAQMLMREGYEVTVVTKNLHELKKWFPHFTFTSELGEYDRIIAQFDYTKERREFFTRDDVEIYYPVYDKKRCPPLKKGDKVFSSDKTMVENIGDGDCGLVPPPGLVHRKFPKRVVIHPTSTDPIRTYSAKKFRKVAKKIQALGFEPVFAVAPGEPWEGPTFPTLCDLATFIYESGYFIGNESGTSHLASCLGIPTLVIAGDKRRIKMWQPGWAQGLTVTPPSWVPNFKGLRLRTNKWQWFISSSNIIVYFKRLIMLKIKV